MKVRVGTLNLGAEFKTILTGRQGVVMGHDSNNAEYVGDHGVAVWLDAHKTLPEEDKYLHREVFVAVEMVH